jgi:hypothetical protein
VSRRYRLPSASLRIHGVCSLRLCLAIASSRPNCWSRPELLVLPDRDRKSG